MSKSTVNRVCQVIKDGFDAFKQRDLGDIELDYLFLDGAHFRMHPGAPAEPVLAAWGVTTQGSPVLLGLAPDSDEGTDPWASFLDDLNARGLDMPLLVITDGAPGLVGAVEVAFPRPLRQRCLIHRARNLLAKVPKVRPAGGQGRVLADLRRHHRRPRRCPVAQARDRAHDFTRRYQHRYPAAVACLLDTLPS